MNESDCTSVAALTESSRLPLRAWASEFRRRWTAATYSLFILHGNIFDIFPVQVGERIEYASLLRFLCRRMFEQWAFLLFYNIGEGLTFGSEGMQKRFFKWLEFYDSTEQTNFHQ